jgi:oxygen-independent coproporphyrinogen III oxidase
MAGIYVHIPFCKQACHYCDFHFSTNLQSRPDLVQAILREIELQRGYLNNETVKTIYFGGGTPSLLTQDELSQILNSIHTFHRLGDRVEITLEANPDDLTPVKLKEFRALGINRLSIGIQSFHPEILSFLNRSHNALTAITSFHHAREAGFNNISMDLIYAIPNETDAMWQEDIKRAITLKPEHISCYSLTIEEKTVFGRWSAAGKLKTVEDEVAANHLEILMTELEDADYEHYEISNFAKPGFRSQHNSSYWKQALYLGVGPSAHSYNGISRQYNVSNNHQYLNSLKKDTIPFEQEVLSRENKINEYILTTLRTLEGADLNKLRQHYEHDLLTQNARYLSTLINTGLATLESNMLRLTRKGKLLADKISSDLFV